MAILITAKGSISDVKPKTGIFELDELQHFIGGYIEIIGVAGRLMVVNEDGKQQELQRNLLATAIAKSYLETDDCIVGDVLVCEPIEMNGM